MAESLLTLKQEEFCQAWVDLGGNGTRAVLKVYDIEGKERVDAEEEYNLTHEKSERTQNSIEVQRIINNAASQASENLRIPKIRKRIDEILNERGFDDDSVKREHFKLIAKADEATKMRAIDSYYKLKGKIIDKSEVKLNVEVSPEAKEKANNAINQFLNGNNPTDTQSGN